LYFCAFSKILEISFINFKHNDNKFGGFWPVSRMCSYTTALMVLRRCTALLLAISAFELTACTAEIDIVMLSVLWLPYRVQSVIAVFYANFLRVCCSFIFVGLVSLCVNNTTDYLTLSLYTSASDLHTST